MSTFPAVSAVLDSLPRPVGGVLASEAAIWRNRLRQAVKGARAKAESMIAFLEAEEVGASSETLNRRCNAATDLGRADFRLFAVIKSFPFKASKADVKREAEAFDAAYAHAEKMA